ncbi:MAG: tetratricopeptide repeat protein [Polyangia bacterium]
MKILGITVAFALCLQVSLVHAQEQPSARQLYDRGIAHYKMGEFEDAIADFKSAYAIEPSDVLLFNLAQAHRQLGDGKRALFFYREFVRQAQPSPARTDAENMVAELEAQQPHRAPAPRVVVETAPAAPLQVREHGLDRRGAITLVASTAALGTALVLGGVGLSVHAEHVSDSLQGVPIGTQWNATYRSRFDDGRNSTNAAIAMYVIGGSAIAASIISAVICRHVLARSTRYAGDLSWHF